jgi:hypothetical protein
MESIPTTGRKAVYSTLERYKESFNGRPEEREIVEDITRVAKHHAHRTEMEWSAHVWVAALVGVLLEQEKQRRSDGEEYFGLGSDMQLTQSALERYS